MRIHTLLMSCWLLSVPVLGQDAAPSQVPFELPVPEGWRTETIAFPPGFAPDLRLEGFEELRFAPGMFDPESEDFWSYVMLWWVPADTDTDPARVADDLRIYYQGLAAAVAPGNGFDPASATTRVTVEPDGAGRLRGTIRTLDAFATGEAVRLTMRIDVVACAEVGRTALIILLSPRAKDRDVWNDLGAIREGFACPS